MANGKLSAYVRGSWGRPDPSRVTGPSKGVVRGPTKGVVRPPAPAVAGAPDGSNSLPWDANYENTIGGINRDLASTNAGLDQQESSTKQQYGFDDLSDPFSRLKLLRESFANAQRGNTNSYAAQGQLYSGALQNAQDASQHGYDINYDSLRRNYDQTLNDIAARRTQAKNTAADNTATADFNRTQTALAARTDPSTLPAASPTASPHGTPTVTAGKDSHGNPGEWHTYPDGRKVFVKKG